MTQTRNIAPIIQRLNDEGKTHLSATLNSIDNDKRTAQVAFSSEGAEVPRWFGKEVLGHQEGEVDLSRLMNGAPLLMDHNYSDQIGVIEKAHIDSDGVGRALVRFGQSKRASEIFQDVKDGIRKNVSVGYHIHSMALQEERNDTDVYRITHWEPLEVSIVSVPADPSVGIGRSLSHTFVAAQTQTDENQQRDNTKPNVKEPNVSEDNPEQTPKPAAKPINHAALSKENILEAERKRTAKLLEIGEAYGAYDLARKYAADPNGSVEQLQADIMQRDKSKAVPQQRESPELGLSNKEIREFSILNLIRSEVSGNKKGAEFEREVSRAAAEKQDQHYAGSLIIPPDVLRHRVGEAGAFSRGMNTGNDGQTGPGSTGNASIATQLLSGSYIEQLQNRTIFAKGTRPLNGLKGPADIPKGIGSTEAFWTGEGQDVRSSTMDFGTVSVKPRSLGASVSITQQTLNQSSLDIEALVRDNMAGAMARAIDLAAFYGDGQGETPLGLLYQTGITPIEFAGNNPTFPELVAMETAISKNNADVNGMLYKANTGFRGYAKSALEFAENGSGTIWQRDNTVNGYGCSVSNQIKDGHIFLGNWEDAALATWGGLEMVIDPYSLSKSRQIEITFFQDSDVVIFRPQSFVIGAPKGSLPTPAQAQGQATS